MFLHFDKPPQTGELFGKLVREVAHAHDWLTGPARSEHDRLAREIAESQGWSRGITGL